MAAQVEHQHLFHGMRLGPEFGGDVSGHAGRPVQPGVAFTPRQIEDYRRRPGAFNDLAFHLLQPHAGGPGLHYLVRHTCLDEKDLAALGTGPAGIGPGLGQGFPYGRGAAPPIPGMGATLLGRIGGGIPHRIGLGGVDRAVRFGRDPPRGDGLADGAHPHPAQGRIGVSRQPHLAALSN
jgi:hypothetical protein